MNRPYIEEQKFENTLFSESGLERGDYELCSFTSCDFSEAGLNEFRFIDCVFQGCNLSNADMSKTSFQDCEFKECKMLGLHFEQCNTLGLSFRFDKCLLNHSSFYSMKLPATRFGSCQLQDVIDQRSVFGIDPSPVITYVYLQEETYRSGELCLQELNSFCIFNGEMNLNLCS